METPTRTPPRSASRSVVVAVLVVLIVVAAAGIVLAGRQASRAPEAPAAVAAAAVPAPAASSTPGADVPPTAAAPDALPTSIRFATGSAALPADQAGPLAGVGDALRASGRGIVLTVRFVGGAGTELGRRRVEVVQHALQSNGISASRIQSETIEVPAGSLLAGDVDRVELAIR